MKISELIILLGNVQMEEGDIDVVDSFNDEVIPEVVEGVLVICEIA